jgi:hypothetical protein
LQTTTDTLIDEQLNLPSSTAVNPRSAWVRARGHFRSLQRVKIITEWRTLPVAELALGLCLVALSHKMSTAGDYSLGRAAVLFAACGLVIAYGFFRNPYAPFYCYAFITPIFPAFGSGLALIAGGIFLIFINRQKVNWEWQFSYAGLAFCLWSMLSLVWAERIFVEPDSFIVQAWPPMVLAFVISGIKDPVFRRNLVLMVVGACVIGSAETVRNWIHGHQFGFGRTYSMIRPDVFSAWALFGLMGTLAWLLAARTAPWLHWILFFSCPVILLGIGLCGFRAAILAAGLGVAVVSICQKRILQGILIAALIGSVALLLYLLVPDMFAPVLSRFQTIQEDRGSDRIDIWAGGLQVFRESPLWGVGCDNFKSSITRYYGMTFLPHSIYVGTLVELGIIGLVLLLVWIGVLLHKTWRAEDRIWCFPLLVVYLFQGGFLHQFYFTCFWLALGLAEGTGPASTKRRADGLTQHTKTRWRFSGLARNTRRTLQKGSISAASSRRPSTWKW